jgi:hypothetical protein
MVTHGESPQSDLIQASKISEKVSARQFLGTVPRRARESRRFSLTCPIFRSVLGKLGSGTGFREKLECQSTGTNQAESMDTENKVSSGEDQARCIERWACLSREHGLSNGLKDVEMQFACIARHQREEVMMSRSSRFGGTDARARVFESSGMRLNTAVGVSTRG